MSIGIPQEKLVITRNGIDLSLFEPLPPVAEDERPLRCAYTSTPYRGLENLLAAWPEIYRQVPTATLQVFSSMATYQPEQGEPDEQPGHLALYDLARSLPGVDYIGAVPQPTLAAALKQCRLLLYPCTFAETSCIAAMEAQAAGCAIVTSHLGALPETAWGNSFVYGNPWGNGFRRLFVARAVELLQAPVLWRYASEQNRQRMHLYSWTSVARQWLSLFSSAAA